MRLILDYLENQIQEIRSHLTLRIYGSLMSLLLILAGGDWLMTGVSSALGRGTEAICWPMFPNCQSWRVIETSGIQLIFATLLLLSILNLLLFTVPRFNKTAFYLLITLNVFKLLIIAFDFRFRLKQHIMAFWVTMVFLFLPKKERSLKVLVVFFYFWAGLLKLNTEWLSGISLYKMPWLMIPALLPWACAYVLILELLLVWGLLFDGTKISWAVLIQLFIFHLFSFPVVGYFYPVTMYTILMIYPLSWGFKWPSSWLCPPEDQETTFRWLLDRRKALPAYGLVMVFSCAQIIPRFMPGDTAITGEGRLFSLHMFDAFTSCEAFAEVRYKDGSSRRVDLKIDHPVRIHCDPITYLSRARFLCKNEIKMNNAFKDLDLSLCSKRASEGEFHQVIDEKDFCTKDLRYSLLSHNGWIHYNSLPSKARKDAIPDLNGKRRLNDSTVSIPNSLFF